MSNDSIILGERKIYVIDVGNMDPEEVNILLEKIKKELKEKEKNSKELVDFIMSHEE